MSAKSKPKTLLLLSLSVLCIIVWVRNVRLMSGESHSQGSKALAHKKTPPSVVLPEVDDFILASRDPFEGTRSPANSEVLQATLPKKPVLLPYMLVGIVGSIKNGKAAALVRDESTGNVLMIAIRDSLMGYSLEHVTSDTLYLSSQDGKALVLAERSP